MAARSGAPHRAPCPPPPHKAHNSDIVKSLQTVIAAVAAALLAAPVAALAQAGAAPLPRAFTPAPFYGLTGPYSLGAHAFPGHCGAGFCDDSVALGRTLRRELHRQELRRELDQRAESAARPPDPNPYLTPRYLPPPTPDSHLQPRYRGTGEIRPEYRLPASPR